MSPPLVSVSRSFYLSPSPSLSVSSSALGPLLSPVSIWCVSSDTGRQSLSVVLLSICEGLVKNPPANAGDIREAGSIPGSGRSPAGGHGNPLQYSYLENPMDRGAWRAAVHRGAKRVRHDSRGLARHSTTPSRALHPWGPSLFTTGFQVSLMCFPSQG